MAKGYSELPNELVSGANGVDYAYRDTGGGRPGAVPLVLFQHFRGNLDNWDPALIDALARTRRVVTFDNAGVGGSAGATPDTVGQIARDALALLAAIKISQADLLGFSIGSFVAQEIALARPAIVRRLVLASAAPQGAAGMHGWAPEVIGAVGTTQSGVIGLLPRDFSAGQTRCPTGGVRGHGPAEGAGRDGLSGREPGVFPRAEATVVSVVVSLDSTPGGRL